MSLIKTSKQETATAFSSVTTNEKGFVLEVLFV